MDGVQKLDMQIDIKIAGKEWSGSLRDVIRIQESRLSEEFAEQPSIYAWFAALTEVAGAEYENKKFGLSVLKANTEKRVRYELFAKGEKTTESAVSSLVQTDDTLINANMALLEVERQYSLLRAVTKSLEQRKDMLIALGAMKRQEMFQVDMGIDIEKVRRTK